MTVENDNLEAVIKEPPPKNMLDNKLDEHDSAKNAVESLESIEHNQEILRNMILKNGSDGKEVIGEIVYKDKVNGVVATSKNVGHVYDSASLGGHEISERVAVVMVDGQERAIAESEYNQKRDNERVMGFEVENDATSIAVVEP